MTICDLIHLHERSFTCDEIRRGGVCRRRGGSYTLVPIHLYTLKRKCIGMVTGGCSAPHSYFRSITCSCTAHLIKTYRGSDGRKSLNHRTTQPAINHRGQSACELGCSGWRLAPDRCQHARCGAMLPTCHPYTGKRTSEARKRLVYEG